MRNSSQPVQPKSGWTVSNEPGCVVPSLPSTDCVVSNSPPPGWIETNQWQKSTTLAVARSCIDRIKFLAESDKSYWVNRDLIQSKEDAFTEAKAFLSRLKHLVKCDLSNLTNVPNTNCMMVEKENQDCVVFNSPPPGWIESNQWQRSTTLTIARSCIDRIKFLAESDKSYWVNRDLIQSKEDVFTEARAFLGRLKHLVKCDISNLTNVPNTNCMMVEKEYQEKTEEVLQKFATIYQDYMKKIELPNNSQLLLPFATWQGLGITLKQLYGQPLHYLTNVELHKWDNLRTGTGYEHIPLDRLIHPFVAEALIRQLENMHRLITPPSYLLKLWLANPIYTQFIDPI